MHHDSNAFNVFPNGTILKFPKTPWPEIEASLNALAKALRESDSDTGAGKSAENFESATKARAQELHAKLTSLDFDTFTFPSEGFRIHKIVRGHGDTDDYRVALPAAEFGEGAVLQVRADGSVLNMTYKERSEIPGILDRVFTLVEKYGGGVGSGRETETDNWIRSAAKSASEIEGKADRLKDKAAFLTSTVMSLTGGGQGSLEFEIPLNGKDVSC